ncbi:hypothetical protein [Sphingomonas sp. VDB2]|uniref:hypothetical protein n=1 Tax=Sphingomonas sp. VDB2 TaxID=3228751 RepID=UPI003A8103B3
MTDEEGRFIGVEGRWMDSRRLHAQLRVAPATASDLRADGKPAAVQLDMRLLWSELQHFLQGSFAPLLSCTISMLDE